MVSDIKNTDKTDLFNIKNEILVDIDNFNIKISRDQRDLIKNVTSILDSYNLILELSKNLKQEHLKEQSDKFLISINNILSQDNMNHDELIKISGLFKNILTKNDNKESLNILFLY